MKRPHEDDIEGITDWMMDYFCMDILVPVKTFHDFANKPWITSDITDLLNKKKKAFNRQEPDEAEECIVGTQASFVTG